MLKKFFALTFALTFSGCASLGGTSGGGLTGAIDETRNHPQGLSFSDKPPKYSRVEKRKRWKTFRIICAAAISFVGNGIVLYGVHFNREPSIEGVGFALIFVGGLWLYKELGKGGK